MARDLDVPKSVPGYIQFLKRELKGSGLYIENTSLKVDSRAMVEIHFRQDIEIEMYRPRKVPKMNPRNPNPWAEASILNAIRDELPVSFKARDLHRVGEVTANWVKRGCLARLDQLALTDSRLRRDLDTEWTKWRIRPKNQASWVVSYWFDLRMVYYGAYVDSGRGKANRPSRMVDRESGKRAFQVALEEWVSRKLGLDGLDAEHVAKAIRKRINTDGYPERPWLRETLKEFASKAIAEKAFETVFYQVFERAVVSGIEKGVTEMGGGVGVEVKFQK